MSISNSLSLPAEPHISNNWRQLIAQGTAAHQRGQFQRASTLFKQALELCQCTGKHLHCPARINMWVISAHNLAASFSARDKTRRAAEILEALHEQMGKLCANHSATRAVRVEALGQLKTTLFSLLSHWSHMGNYAPIQAELEATEALAERTAQQLFH